MFLLLKVLCVLERLASLSMHVISMHTYTFDTYVYVRVLFNIHTIHIQYTYNYMLPETTVPIQVNAYKTHVHM